MSVRIRERRLLRGALGLALVLLIGVGGAGTAAGRKEKKGEDRKERKQYTVNETMYKKLSKALESLQEEQYDVTVEVLRPLEGKASRLNPYERALVYQLLGFVESSQERYDEALVYFEKCLAEDALPVGQQLSTRFNVAQLYLATERFAEAADALVRWFEEAEKPTSTAYYLLAVAYYQMGEIDRAIPPAERSIEVAKTPKEPWLQLLAGLYYEAQRYAEAVAPIEQLVTLYPKKVYWTQLSALYSHLGHGDKALAALQLAYEQGLLDLDRDLRQLAMLYLLHGLPYRGALVLEKGLGEGTVEGDADSWGMLANCWLLAKENERALEPLAKAAELSETGDVYVRLAQVYLQREDWKEASTALTRALRKGELNDPGSVHLLLGIAAYHQNQPERARKYFATAQTGESNESSRKSASQWLKLIEQESQRG